MRRLTLQEEAASGAGTCLVSTPGASGGFCLPAVMGHDSFSDHHLERYHLSMVEDEAEFATIENIQEPVAARKRKQTEVQGPPTANRHGRRVRISRRRRKAARPRRLIRNGQ